MLVTVNLSVSESGIISAHVEVNGANCEAHHTERQRALKQSAQSSLAAQDRSDQLLAEEGDELDIDTIRAQGRCFARKHNLSEFLPAPARQEDVQEEEQKTAADARGDGGANKASEAADAANDDKGKRTDLGEEASELNVPTLAPDALLQLLQGKEAKQSLQLVSSLPGAGVVGANGSRGRSLPATAAAAAAAHAQQRAAGYDDNDDSGDEQDGLLVAGCLLGDDDSALHVSVLSGVRLDMRRLLEPVDTDTQGEGDDQPVKTPSPPSRAPLDSKKHRPRQRRRSRSRALSQKDDDDADLWEV